MKLTGIKALIFDMGGTLYEPVSDMCSLTRDFLEVTEAGDGREYTDTIIKTALQEPDEWLSDYMIKNNVDVHWQPQNEQWIEYDRILLEALGVQNQELVHQYQAKWDEFVESARPQMIEGINSILHELRGRGFKMGIASNRFSNPARILERDSIIHLFDVVEYTNVPGYRKPSPYMLLRAAEQLGINPHSCAYIGNIVNLDVLAAERAGMVPILLTWVDPQEIHKIESDIVVINHLADLLEIL